VWPARSAGRGGALVQGRPGAAAGCGSGAALAASVEGRNSWHAMSVFTRSARWLTAGSVPRLNTDQRAGEQAAHSLFMPERMQLLIVTSISCVLQPAAQTQLVSSHGTVRRRRDTLREQAKRAAAQFARAGNALLRILRPPAARKLCGHRTQLDRWHGSVPGQWVIGRPPGEDDGMHAGRDVLHHDHACLAGHPAQAPARRSFPVTRSPHMLADLSERGSAGAPCRALVPALRSPARVSCRHSCGRA